MQTIRSARTLILLLSVLYSGKSIAQEMVVVPYLQDATPTSIEVMWETSQGGDCKILWGSSKTFENESERVFSIINKRPSEIHRAPINNLKPSTKYFYKVVTGSLESEVYYFTTPPLAEEDKSFRMVAFSDMQRDDRYPDKFKEIVEEGVIPVLEDINGEDVFKDLGMILIPGDLTREGDVYTDWTDDFFRQSKSLLPYVPVYPVLGNHEKNADYYFNYFHLPDNGSPGYMEHWYFKDYGNVRIIGLNSNTNYTIQTQLDWLDQVLQDAAHNDNIDFVFAQLHHPHKSELWIDGERDYTGKVITQLEEFSSRTGKPSLHFYGHTHGYSRGQSKDHTHLWVNVATAGGKIDGWGEYAQTNYEEFSKTTSDYGFVLMDIQAGKDPQFELTRYSRGNIVNPKNNEILDLVKIKRFDPQPQTPTCIAPIEEAKMSPDKIVLKASPFSGNPGQEHGASQWQVARTYNFANPDVDIWKHHEDWYNGEDLNQGINLTEQMIDTLRPQTEYSWRVRYRTKGLVWSDWSVVQKFVTK